MPACRSKEDTACVSLDIINEDAAVSGNKPSFRGPYVLENCLRKLYVSVEMNNEGKVSGDDEYILIEEVLDPLSDVWTPLLNPVVLKMHREQPQLIYPLDFQQVVNGGAYEESFYSAINDSSEICDQSLCGVTEYNGATMPFSEGFCCSCNNPRKEIIAPYYSNPISLTDPELVSHFPVKRSVSPVEDEVESKRCPPKKPATPACALKKKNKCKKRPPNFFFENDKVIIGKSNERLRCMNKSSSPHNSSHKGQVYLKEEKSRKVRSLKHSDSLRKRVDEVRLKRVSDLKQSHRHFRSKSRQACESGNSSVHCLKLSDLWYSVYRFQAPIVVQEISLQVFQKKDDSNGREYWVDLTRAQTIKLGTFYPRAADALPSISFSYSSQLDPSGEVGKDMSPINIESNVLLIPTHMESTSKTENYPQAEGGPSEYLVVSKADLSTDGKGCDRIGTLFEGFTRQNRRCERPEGSCLNHQPSDLWVADMERRIRGERGKHFVENFGEVASAVLASSVETVKKDYLAFNFQTPFRSLIEVEIRADTNSLIRQSGNAQIQSITADSSGLDRSVVEVLVVNTGLAPGHFRPWLVECNEDLPPDCVPQGPLVFLPPLHRHFFRIFLEGPLPAAEMTCTVEVHNLDGQRIASRAVTFKKLERCLCAYHCSCSCSGENFACSPLMEEEYAAAGFGGRMTTGKVLVPGVAPLEAVYVIVVMVTFFLLLLGKLKLIFGWFSRKMKMFGVNFLMEHLHPCFRDCTEKSLCQRGLYFFLNWFFFPVYFLMILWMCVRKIATVCMYPCRCISSPVSSVRKQTIRVKPLVFDTALVLGNPLNFYAGIVLIILYVVCAGPSNEAQDTARRCKQTCGHQTEEKSQDYTYEMEAEDEKFVIQTMDSLKMFPAKRSQSNHSM